jgi:hypothetical protein
MSDYGATPRGWVLSDRMVMRALAVRLAKAEAGRGQPLGDNVVVLTEEDFEAGRAMRGVDWSPSDGTVMLMIEEPNASP